MLLVNAKADSSKIHRNGLFAQEFIPKGTVIWKLQQGFDVEISPEQFQALPPPIQSQVRYYAFFCRSTKTFFLSSDDDRFTNHSENPNTVKNGDYEMVAKEDIYTGEEITCDYRDVGMLDIPDCGGVPCNDAGSLLPVTPCESSPN